MRIFNLTISFILILFLFTSSSSCVRHHDKKVGLLLHDMEGRWFTDIEFLKKDAANAGLELVIKVAGGDENKQLHQAEELVNEGVGVLLVVPVNQNTAAGIVRTAHKSHIPVIAYDRIIVNSDLDYLISYDYKQIGQMLAKYSYNKVPEGNYVMLWGDASDNNAQLMRKGEEEFLKPYVDRGDITLIYRSYTEEWSNTIAAQTMQKVVDYSGKRIDVVIAGNDNIGLAALQVIKQSGISYPTLITGQDATLEACKSIINGGMTMSIYKSTNQLASEAIQLAKDILQGKKIEKAKDVVNNNRKDVPAIFLKPVIIDKDNVFNVVINDGLYTKDELLAK
jgi:D-xylose transport system substrate-binding protein